MRSLKLAYGALFVSLLLAGCGQTDPAIDAETDSTPNDTSTAVTPETPVAEPLAQRDEIIQAVYARADELELCDGYLQEETLDDSEVYVLSSGQYLVQFLCNLAAYQGVYEFLVYQEEGTEVTITPLPLDMFIADETGQFSRISESTIAGLPSFDPESQILTNFSKARGLGDCGAFSRYQWNGEGLELIEYREKECDSEETPFIEPQDYPQVYP
ncbi:DUF1176 domain-containing protein [Almyronema epifaneia]|uniref:DUF1176 domain-containing protein n=1 Tax=Almyronema epifaneia S1 TaxID=2991925 RepID=A0ABW6IGB7_9CYAN